MSAFEKDAVPRMDYGSKIQIIEDTRGIVSLRGFECVTVLVPYIV